MPLKTAHLIVRKGSGLYSIYPPSKTTGDDLIIYPNITDSVSKITLFGDGAIYCYVKSGVSFQVIDGAVGCLGISRATTDTKITSLIDGNDLNLLTTGAGVVKFGTYTAGAAADSTGYITVKDAAGNTRKLMVQA